MNQNIIIKNISVVDKNVSTEDRCDIYICDGIIKKIGNELETIINNEN